MSSKRLSLVKILKFASENDFQPYKIFKIRGDVRFIILTNENGGEIMAVEILPKRAPIDRSEMAKSLKSSEPGQKHVSHWSLMSAKLTDNDLICIGSEDITIFKHDGETKGYRISFSDEKEDDSDTENTPQIMDIEKRATQFIQEAEIQKLKERRKQHPIIQKPHIIFKDENDKILSEEDLKDEIVDMAALGEEDIVPEEVSDFTDSLREKLEEISQLDDDSELDLGEFYLLVSISEFYRDIDNVRKRLINFYSVMREEEESIRKNRLENIVLTLSSLHETIQNAFRFYIEKQSESKSKLKRLTDLYKKLSTKSELSESKKEAEQIKSKLKQLIKKEKQDIFTIRDTTNILLGKLELDAERISQRCALPSTSEEEE